MSGSSLWTVTIRKSYGAEDWTNVYTVDASTLSSAIGIGQNIVAIERAIHYSGVQFRTLEVRPAILGSGGGTVVALSGSGTAGADNAPMPLFNTVRVTFRPAAGKPSHKYLRLPVQEGATVGPLLDATMVTFITNNYAIPMAALSGYVDVDGQPFTSYTVWNHVQERQLKRKRRSRVGQKRGWVPA